jgi:CsoR family transcriptional regulator, copper-sensing transcriptional repressor
VQLLLAVHKQGYPCGGDSSEESGMRGYTEDKDGLMKRLRRIEGQIRGLQRMVENDEYCIDILTQISAATKALQAVSLGLMDEHLRHCVAEAIAEGGTSAEAKVREASDAIARLVRS